MRLWTLLLFAAAAAAEPHVRWIDRTGGARHRKLAAVLSEDTSEVELELEDGKALTLRTRSLLDLVRESDKDPDQRALLEARRAVRFGGGLDGARPVLDRLAAGGKKDWIREYAAAARAVLAERAGDKDALERLEAFARKHPRSRFRAQLVLARARILSRSCTKLEEAQDKFAKAYLEMDVLRGPLLVQFQSLVDGARRMLDFEQESFDLYFAGVAGHFESLLGKGAAGDARVVFESCLGWARLVREKDRRERITKRGDKPFGALARVRKLRDESTFLLPGLRCDIDYELGLVYEACGKTKEAQEAFAASIKKAPDAWRRDRAAKKRRPR